MPDLAVSGVVDNPLKHSGVVLLSSVEVVWTHTLAAVFGYCCSVGGGKVERAYDLG